MRVASHFNNWVLGLIHEMELYMTLSREKENKKLGKGFRYLGEELGEDVSVIKIHRMEFSHN